MTSISLHPLPEQRTIASEQLSAVGIALRKEGMVFFAALVILSALSIAGAIRAAGNPHQHMGFSYGPGAAIPMMLVGLLLPFGVWRNENPERRSYHWAMPIARGPHTLMKVMSGWLWLMAATAVYLIFLVAVGAAMSYITGAFPHNGSAALWEWAIPFTAATVAYMLISIVVLASDHPWRWIGGLVIGDIVIIGFLQALKMRDVTSMLESITNGYYGLNSALFAQVNDFGGPSIQRWFGATALWGALGAMGVVIASYRKAG